MPSDRALHTQLFLVIINHSETWISQSSRNKIKLEKENIEIYIYKSFFFHVYVSINIKVYIIYMQHSIVDSQALSDCKINQIIHMSI